MNNIIMPQFWAVCGRNSGRGTLTKQSCAAKEFLGSVRLIQLLQPL